MTPFQFLSVGDVIRLHDRTIEAQGGSPGLREMGLLESAVSMPQQTWGGDLLHPTLAAIAGAYLFHICQAHAFVDGNKRAAVLAALTFLVANGTEDLPDPGELEEITLAIARGEMSKDQMREWLEERLAA